MVTGKCWNKVILEDDDMIKLFATVFLEHYEKTNVNSFISMLGHTRCDTLKIRKKTTLDVTVKV